ncbi:MAG: outer membrane protein assembly factor BamB [Burkholderiaceae bacterium]|jgi:outer membrane protein assembly factor BamB|nr:outer membrane protein assembly factor BamB [Burkholderiales bacterium]MCZ8107511.1 outer membrane protein assembly factor BamB [Burkholderiales bacterium]MCZ8337635.1 outer membrane protein assembly factor BamB [Burkholderiaceae bacterium]
MRHAAAALAALAALGGCSLFGSSRTPPDPLPAPSGAIKPAPMWTAALGARSGIGFVPVAIGDSVWAAAQDGTVVRLDVDTGRATWRVSVGKPLSAGVGTDGTTTVVATRDGSLVALDAQGATRWTAPVGAEVVSAPAVADGTVLVRTSDNRVVAYDTDNGKRRWQYQRQNPPLVLRNSGGIAMVPGLAFIGMPGGRMVALALGSGAPRWDVPLAQPRGTTELERIADVVGSPLVIGRELCAASYQGRVGCLDAATGAPVWIRDFSSAVGLDVDNRGVVLPDANDVVHAFDRAGQPAWQQKGFARRRLAAPLIVGSGVAIGDVEGNVLWLSRADGTLAAVTKTDGKPIVAPPAAVGSTLVVQTSGGTLHAFRVP